MTNPRSSRRWRSYWPARVSRVTLRATHAKRWMRSGPTVISPIIVTDLKMPSMDGLAMVRTLQEDLPAGRDVAVIVITGHGETDDAIEALRLGRWIS